MGKFARLAVAILLAASWYSADLSAPRPVAALSCGTNTHQWFAGVAQYPSVVKGAKANIEFVDEHLCTTSGADDFSSFWASVVGSTSNYDIYQIGVDKCKGLACVAGVP